MTVANRRRWIRRSEDEWRELLAQFERSGQTQEQFCTDHDLVLSTFARWRHNLSERAMDEPIAERGAMFVELASEHPEQRWDLELDLGAGMVLRLRRQRC